MYQVDPSERAVQPGLTSSRPLRIALLSYRSKPHCGGQGVYIRHLSRELTRLGHDVEVISGPPYPELDPGPRLTKLTSLDLFADGETVRIPRLNELRDPMNALEFGVSMKGTFPEPLAFSVRAWRLLKSRAPADWPDIVHDNQTLGYGMLLMQRDGMNVAATIHHPITVDLKLSLAAEERWRKRFGLRRFYSFLPMQKRVARRIPSIMTVSDSSYRDLRTDFGVSDQQLTMVPLGVLHDVFTPPSSPRVPGRIVAAASADVPLKGVRHLLESVAALRADRNVELVLIGRLQPNGPTAAAIEQLGLADAVRFVSNVSEAELVELMGSASVGVVPSLYEGFSLPAAELMSCATPLVATRAGALPEVVGPDGESVLLVPPGDSAALTRAIARLLDDPKLAARLGQAARQRVLERFTWSRVASQTVDWYKQSLISAQ